MLTRSTHLHIVCCPISTHPHIVCCLYQPIYACRAEPINLICHGGVRDTPTTEGSMAGALVYPCESPFWRAHTTRLLPWFADWNRDLLIGTTRSLLMSVPCGRPHGSRYGISLYLADAYAIWLPP